MPRIIQPVANSVVPLEVVYPEFRLRGATPLPNGAFLFTLTGATGRVYAIETSADLSNWSALATLTNQTGNLLFTNPPSPNTSRSYYRGREQ
jgi:hypothetical protein